MPEKEDKKYSPVEEAQDIIISLVQQYPEELWPVKPAEVIVMGVTNKSRPPSQRALARIHMISPLFRSVFEKYGIPLKFLIELYFSDWAQWNIERKQWILLHELMHIAPPDSKGLTPHDTEDFSPLIAAAGVRWWESSNLPNLIASKFPFDKGMFNALHMGKKKNPEDEAATDIGLG